jgi:hypothetical protein
MNSNFRPKLFLIIMIFVILISTSILFMTKALANSVSWYLWLPIAMNNYPLTIPPTPAPTPPPAENVHILPNHSTYAIAMFDWRVVVGEVKNNTASSIEYVRITVKFYDINDSLIDFDWGYTYLDTLHSGENTCFSILLLDEPEGWAYYEFSPVEYSTTGITRPNLTLLSHNGSYDPMFGSYRIIGEVRNDHAASVDFVMPVFTLYNSTGTVIDCDFTFTEPSTLVPGQTSPFENYFVFRDDYSDVAEYSIQLDGMP